jgi:hypothetical protein
MQKPAQGRLVKIPIRHPLAVPDAQSQRPTNRPARHQCGQYWDTEQIQPKTPRSKYLRHQAGIQQTGLSPTA